MITIQKKRYIKALSLHWKTDWLPQCMSILWKSQGSLNVYTFQLSRKEEYIKITRLNVLASINQVLQSVGSTTEN